MTTGPGGQTGGRSSLRHVGGGQQKRARVTEPGQPRAVSRARDGVEMGCKATDRHPPPPPMYDTATHPLRAGEGWNLPKNLSALDALTWTVGSEGCEDNAI